MTFDREISISLMFDSFRSTSRASERFPSGFVVPPPLPAARQSHAAVLLERSGVVVVFGGRGETTDRRAGPRAYLNDVLVFDPRRGSWRTHAPLDGVDWPSPRHNHSMCVVADTLVIFGGSGAAGFVNDLWLLRFEDGDVRFSRVSETAPWPTARHGHACTVIEGHGRPFVVLQGGHSGRQSEGATYHGDLWLLDLVDGVASFSLVEAPLAPGSGQSRHKERSWHSMVTMERNTVALGFGYSFRNRAEFYFGDLWLIEFELNGSTWRTNWRQLTVTGDATVMVARNRVAWCALDGRRVFSCGGNEFDGRRDEFYSLPCIFEVDAEAGRVHATLLRSRAESKTVRLGHAVALRVSESEVLICGGELNRRRLDVVVGFSLAPV
jgi:hypothetical protein